MDSINKVIVPTATLNMQLFVLSRPKPMLPRKYPLKNPRNIKEMNPNP